MDEIFQKMLATEMKEWVGGGDPKVTGISGFDAIDENIKLKQNMKVLDFGCGIGRTSLPMADYLKEGELIGIDVILDQIVFCEAEISAKYKNTKFFVNKAKNPLYDRFVKSENENFNSSVFILDDQLVKTYSKYFDLIYCYSVFTHFNPEMTFYYLNLLSKCLKNNGILFISFFLDRFDNKDSKKLKNNQFFLDAIPEIPLQEAIYDVSYVSKLLEQEKMFIQKTIYGHWRSKIGYSIPVKGVHYQDLIIARKKSYLPESFSSDKYLAVNQDVAQAKVDPIEHYLNSGFYEDRAYE